MIAAAHGGVSAHSERAESAARGEQRPLILTAGWFAFSGPRVSHSERTCVPVGGEERGGGYIAPLVRHADSLERLSWHPAPGAYGGEYDGGDPDCGEGCRSRFGDVGLGEGADRGVAAGVPLQPDILVDSQEAIDGTQVVRVNDGTAKSIYREVANIVI